MGLEELRLTRGDMQIGLRMRRIMGQAGREGVAWCAGSQDRQSVLKCLDRRFMERVPGVMRIGGLHAQGYKLTDLGRDALIVLKERGLME